MKKQIITIILTCIVMMGIFTGKAAASHTPAGSSAMLVTTIPEKLDNREQILSAYLKKYNSPLVPYVHSFVSEADKNNIDYRLLVAIAGVESTFGKAIPTNSYNGWGWGIYGTNMHNFASWNDAITTISSELRTRYMNQWGANDVYAIGKYYAASPTWASRVDSFMQDIDNFGNTMENTSLSISL